MEGEGGGLMSGGEGGGLMSGACRQREAAGMAVVSSSKAGEWAAAGGSHAATLRAIALPWFEMAAAPSCVLCQRRDFAGLSLRACVGGRWGGRLSFGPCSPFLPLQ